MPLICCGVVRILSRDVLFCKLVGRIFENNGKYKRRYEGKLKYRTLTMMWSEGGSLIGQKRRGNYL